MRTGRPKVTFVFRGDRSALSRRVAEGQSPNEFLYGLPFFDPALLDVGYVEDADPFRTPVERALRPWQTLFGRRYRVGFNLHSYWRHRKRLAVADAIVTTTDSYGLPVLWRKRSGSLPGKVIYFSQGLHELVGRAERGGVDELTRRIIGRWLRVASAIVVFGEGDARFLDNAFADGPALPVHVIQFGVDEAFWTPADVPADGAILSVGSDFLRDYGTLVRAIGERPLRIVTRLPVEQPSANVDVDGNVDDLGLRELYRRAPFVVMPVVETRRDAGHSATLQAMACGKAVILSCTRGLWDPARMRDGETCLLVPPGDVAALRAAIERLAAEPETTARIGRNARALIQSAYNARAFGTGLQSVTLDVLRGRPA